MTDLPSLSLDEAIARVESMTDVPSGNIAPADTRDGRVYVTSPEIVTAVKVALVTGRPLLLGGPPGTGKSSLAAYVARNLGVAYYDFTAVDESRSADLLWTTDAVRRLADAQAGRFQVENNRINLARYIEPAPLWWALDPDSARVRGLDPDTAEEAGLAQAHDPAVRLDIEPQYAGCVLLVDEIDKADNAFSNGLLVPLGARQFDVAPLGTRVETTTTGWAPLVIISTNNERDLSPAFLRRCVTLVLPEPDADHLVTVARRHLTSRQASVELHEAIDVLARSVVDEVDNISAAEFLDLVRIMTETGDLEVQGEEWALIRRLVLDKDVHADRRFLR